MTLGVTRQEGSVRDLCALRNVQWQFTAHVCASVSPVGMQGYFTSCDVGVRLLCQRLLGSVWAHTGGATGK